MFTDFLQEMHYKCTNHFDELEDTFKQDNSGYVYVDGEEGDYGVVLYYDSNNNLVATKTIYGGDCESVEFTSFGLRLIQEKLIKYIKLNLFSDIIVTQRN